MVKKAKAHKFLSGITTGRTELGMPSTPLAAVGLYSIQAVECEFSR
jgi:hypothetical protein